MPRTAATLLKGAIAAGWTARATYAKAEIGGKKARALAAGDRATRNGQSGTIVDVYHPKGGTLVGYGVLVDGTSTISYTWPVDETEAADVSGREGAVVESVAVRLRRWPLAAVGVWEGGKFRRAYVWSAVTSARAVGARDLAKFVKGVPK